MKIIASLFVLVALGSQAQTLSKGDITPVIGDSFMVQIYNNRPQINLEHAGINQVWDLSQITRSAEVNKYYRVVHPDSTPFDIPFASFAYRYFLDTDTTSIWYTYFKDSMHGFYELADILPYRNIEYSNAEFIFKLPLILNDSITDYSCYSTVLSTFYDELCGVSGLKFDGTGILILPTGTYTDMYRLAYTNYYYRKSIGDTIYTQSWFWYKKGTHFP